MRLMLLLFTWMLICSQTIWIATGKRIRCNIPDHIENANMNRRGMFLRINCHRGFHLQGSRTIECRNGKWQDEKPVCAAAGCQPLSSVENGLVVSESPYKAVLVCREPYEIAGNRYTYCNGTDWDRPLGNCRIQHNQVHLSCDFEVENICGWLVDQLDKFEWKRVATVNRLGVFSTGPRHDHTVSTHDEGHYMLMESIGGLTGYVKMMSPIYSKDLSWKTACCFRFYYFLYGSGVGTLSVFVKPVTIPIHEMLASNDSKYLKFQKSGNQINLWKEGKFDIDNQDEDFQIIFAASDAKSHLSDIAIDDVELLTGSSCHPFEITSTTEDSLTNYDTGLDYDDFSKINVDIATDTQSCKNRCGSEVSILYTIFQKHVLPCSCYITCAILENCCIDFRSECDSYIFHTIFNENEISTTALSPVDIENIMSTTIEYISTTTASTTTTTTTTTKQPLTTKTTTTTTTKQPLSTTTFKKPIPPTLIRTTKTTPTIITTTSTQKPTTSKTTLTNPPKVTTTTTTKITTPKIRTTPTPTTTSTTTTTKRTTVMTTTEKQLNQKGAIISAWITAEDKTSVNSAKRIEINKKTLDSYHAADHHSRSKQGMSQTSVLLTVMILVMCLVVLGTLYHRHAPLFHALLASRCRFHSTGGCNGREDSGERADIETNSITAEFRRENDNKLVIQDVNDENNENSKINANNSTNGNDDNSSESITQSAGTKLVKWLQKKQRLVSRNGRRDGMQTPLVYNEEDEDDDDDDDDVNDSDCARKIPNRFSMQQGSTIL